MVRPLSHIAVVLLVALGLTALALAANPKVSDQYRAFYIDRTTDCWPANANGELPASGRIWFLSPANKDATKKVLECGWIDPEPTGAWSSGEDVRLAIKPTGRGPWTVDLDLLPFSGAGVPPQRVTIVAGEHKVLEAELSQGGEIQYRLQLDQRHLDEQGRAILKFSLPDAISPFDLGLQPDRRRLAVRLLSLNVGPVARREPRSPTQNK